MSSEHKIFSPEELSKFFIWMREMDGLNEFESQATMLCSFFKNGNLIVYCDKRKEFLIRSS